MVKFLQLRAVLPERALHIVVTAAEANAMGMKPSERVIDATAHYLRFLVWLGGLSRRGDRVFT